jgi:hypothetical protein
MSLNTTTMNLSSTSDLTIAQAAATPHLLYRLKGDFRASFKELCKQMAESGLFPLPLIPSDQACQAMTLTSLGIFLLQVMDPAVLFYDNNADAQDQVLSFHDSLQKIIENQLPKDEKMEEFLLQCRKTIEDTLTQELNAALMEEKRDQMIATANELNQLNLNYHRRIQQGMREVQDQRKAGIRSMKEQLDALDAKIIHLYSKGKELGSGIEQLVDQLKIQEDTCLKFLSKLYTQIK